MKKMLKTLTTLTLLLGMSACSTNRSKRIACMFGGAVVGGVAGKQMAPSDAQEPTHYAALGAGAGTGVAAAICGELLFSDTARANRLEKENHMLKNPPTFVKLKGNKGKLAYPKGSSTKDNAEYRLYEFKKPQWLQVGERKYEYKSYIEKVDKEDKKKKNEK